MLLQAKEMFEQSVAEVKNPGTGSLRLGITPGFATMFLPAIFSHFQQSFPHIALDVIENGTHAVVEQLHHQLIDVGVFALSDLVPFDLPDLTIHKLSRTELVVVASQHHDLAHKDHISRRQLESQGIIDYSDTSIIRTLLRAVLGPQAEANILCSTNNFEAVLLLTRTSTGITFVSRCIVEAEHMAAKLSGLRVLKLAPDMQFPLQYVCAYRQNHIRAEHIYVLAGIIEDCFRTL